MTLSATATQGFERAGYVSKDEVLWVPGDPGDTFAPGDLVVFTSGEGVADLIAADETPYGVVAGTKSIVCPSATSAGFPTVGGAGDKHAFWGEPPDSETLTLIPIYPLVPAGTPIFKATFASHADDLVASYDSSTPHAGMTTDLGADDDGNGGLVYVYAGTGAGQWNIAADYDAADGTPDKKLIFHRKFVTDLSTDSYIILLEGEGTGAAGVGFFGRCVPGDRNNLVVNNGADDGDFTVYLDARQAPQYLKALTLPVIPSALLLFA